MNKKDFSEIVHQSWEEIRIEMIEVSRQLWSLAEIGMLERQSSSLLADWCESNGFVVQSAAGGLPTAFTARYGEGKPTIGLLAEYDALPGLSPVTFRSIVRRAWQSSSSCFANGPSSPEMLSPGAGMSTELTFNVGVSRGLT